MMIIITNPNTNKFQQYIKMSISYIRLNQVPSNNQSFSHQQSINPNVDSKSKKKGVGNARRLRHSNFQRLKTDQRQSPIIFKNQAINPNANSMHLTRSKFSASHLHKNDSIKGKMTKKVTSVINLKKSVDEPKAKQSSTTTKRKRSVIDIGEGVKQKLKAFSIISTCLQEYVKDQRKNNNEIIGAFNRSQIAPISKHLQKFIAQIIKSINNSLPEQNVSSKSQACARVPIKPILKRSITFQSPQEDDKQQGTTKKPIIYKEYSKQHMRGQSSKLQQNLNVLKYQSNRLKFFLDEISFKNKQSKSNSESSAKKQEQFHKLQQLRRLKEIANEQEHLIRQLGQDSEQSQTFRLDQGIQ